MTSTREHADAGDAMTEQQAAGPVAPATRAGATARHVPEHGDADSLVVEDLLVEDVSIDGMCGVY